METGCELQLQYLRHLQLLVYRDHLKTLYDHDQGNFLDVFWRGVLLSDPDIFYPSQEGPCLF